MIPSLHPDIEGFDWTYDDVVRELDDLATGGLEGYEPDAGARLELEDEGARDAAADDDIGRAVEEIEQHDEGA